MHSLPILWDHNKLRCYELLVLFFVCFPASQTPFVAFDVHYSHDPYNGVANHDVMKFDVVEANVGNGYNPQNGMFQVGSKAPCCQTPDCELLLAKIIITCSVLASRLLLAKIIITCSVLASRLLLAKIIITC